MKARAILRSAAEFPALLREISSPPERLYAIGKRLEPAPHVAVVGSRTPTRYGVEVATAMGRALAQAGVTVVSGMARGIDTAAHVGALESGVTVAVLGTGIDICYPIRNRALFRTIAERGTIVSEYEDGMPALPQNFPTRNRIIAGMSLATVIVEGRIGGGAMITARLAMESGREVFAVPGPAHSPQSAGPHSLVRDGARLVTSAADVLEDLGLRVPDTNQSELLLSPDEMAIVEALEATPVILDLVAAKARMPTSGAAATIARLELKGVVSRYPGGRFALAAGVERATKADAGRSRAE